MSSPAGTAWGIEDIVAVAKQFEAGKAPFNNATFDRRGRSAGACYSLWQKLQSQDSVMAQRHREHLQAFGAEATTELPVLNEGLNEKQEFALSLALEGHSIFLTGGAGVGKSFIGDLIKKAIVEMKGEDAVAITASTGVAASHHDKACTLHSWMSAFPGVLTQEPHPRARERWAELRNKNGTLILDEVSLIDSEFFEMMLRHSEDLRGIQIIIIGDFLQLPPVGGRYAFEGPGWARLNCVHVELTELVRQGTDPLFGKVLARMRKGIFTGADKEVLAVSQVSSLHPLPSEGLQPLALYCTKAEVNARNQERLVALPGAITEFHAPLICEPADLTFADVGEQDEKISALRKQMSEQADDHKFSMKIGAQVILTHNWPEKSLFNGACGVVVGYAPSSFEPRQEFPKFSAGVDGTYDACPRVRFQTKQGMVETVVPPHKYVVGNLDTGRLTRIALPLQLAWAITIHKAQGMTLERAEVDVSRAFSDGQVYTALSRLRSRQGLWIHGSIGSVRANARALKIYE